MANTYSKIYIQIVFAVQGRVNCIPSNRREELNKYITGLIAKKGHKMLAVNCVSNHVHAFVGLKSPVAISDIARDIKSNSSRFINDHKWVKGVFRWQEGYGAFSYSHSHIDKVVKYILIQEEHHKKTSFKEEYLSFLKKFDVDYDDQYLFDWDE